MTERDLHLAVVDYLSRALAGSAWYTTFPLGGGGKVRGAQLKRAGAKVGTPDILVIDDGRAHWIELKAPKGRVSAEQTSCHAELQRAGAAVGVARSIEDVEALLVRWLVPLRGRLRA